MKVNELITLLGAEIITLEDGDREIENVYAGDLLSWVMGRAPEGALWITIMTNRNVLAVASLHDFSCVLITDGAELDDDFKSIAEAQGINVIRTALSTYEACVTVGRSLS